MSRTSRFAQFLRAAVAIKQKAVLEVNKYPSVTWFSELPAGLKEIRSPLLTEEWPADDTRWLVVARVPDPPRPTEPETCRPWLTGVDLDLPSAPPALLDHYSTLDDAGVEVNVAPSQEVIEQWNAYLAGEWLPWSEKARVARLVRPIYQKLFAVHQELKGKDDAYDLFLGVGLFESRKDPAQRIRRHFLAFSAVIALDERSGTLTVGPSPDFVQMRVEIDFLPIETRSMVQPVIDGMVLKAIELGPFVQRRDVLGELVTDIVHSLDANTEYVDSLAGSEALAGAARSSFAPAVILRPRSLRSLDALLAQIEKASADDADSDAGIGLPLPWRRMMEQDSGLGDGAGGGGPHGAPAGGDERVYFPLPSNEEQARIIRHARGGPGVVVQGPPGTGKSHTIANLISHYLAKGQRVLVTAQTAQALQVLRDKLPMELQQLCVNMLGESGRNDKELQRSVDAILARWLSFDPGEQDHEIARLEDDLVRSETALVAHERLLRQARAAETETLEPIVGYRGTKSAIARQIRDERPRLGWIKDPLAQDTRCPTYSLGWDKLGEYHASLTPDVRASLTKVCVQLPFEPTAALNAVREVHTAQQTLSELAVAVAAPPPISSTPEELTQAIGWLGDLQRAEAGVGVEDHAWIASVRRELLVGEPVRWKALLQDAKEVQAQFTDEFVAATIAVEVVERDAVQARRDLARLSEHYKSGGKARTFWGGKPKVVEETAWVCAAVQIDGRGVSQPNDVHRALRAMDGWAALDRAGRLWPGVGPAAGSARQQCAVLAHRIASLGACLNLRSVTENMSGSIRNWLSNQLQEGAKTADLLDAARRLSAERALARAQSALGALAVSLQLAIDRLDVVSSLRALLAALKSAESTSLAAALKDLAADQAVRAHHGHYSAFIDSLRAVAPKTAGEVVAGEGSETWKTAFRDFESAWRHALAASWLEVVISSERIDAVDRAARDERRRAQEILGKLTGSKAWRHALTRIDDPRRTALVAWSQAVRNIPATGQSVFRKRAVARTFLDKCRDAIPVWVVSLGRLYEAVEPVPGLFDVAIVDEASQCWLDSLVLLYLAKQIIVVGDDKQISPTVVGVGDEQMSQLVRTYLQDFEYGPGFTIGSSLFDHAQKYLSAGVPLREHFRSVPEIIRFSNELCYVGNPLIPLRQVGQGRLEPLKTSFVADGLRRGDVNDKEAEAIVQAIVECDVDPAYEDADFGVICLQGDAQADRIQHLLLDRLGPTVFEKRRLRCGNPYAFQGDERDVMFLSMVAAPNANNATLTEKRFEQRFNVAMSRARDQAWLFHSIQEDELGLNCLRRRVLHFFRQPPDMTINGVSVDTPTLQLIAERADRMAERPPQPFDSWFEVDVALALTARGYRMSAQVKVGPKSIDLVVEGQDGLRLAVECDGEFWHGPDEFERDLFRQRQLERAEWRFARVRECLFYTDEQRAIDEVVDACEELGITPGGGRAEAPPVDVAVGIPTLRLRELDVVDDEVEVAEPEPQPEPETDEPVEDAGEVGDEEQGPVPRSLLADNRSGPFTGYASKTYPDPKSATPATIREAVLDIVSCDGPLPKASIYRLYRDGCPRIERASKLVRHAVNQAVYHLERSGVVASRDEGKSKEPTEILVRLVSQPWVQRREVGARTLDDIPLSEIAEAMRTAWRGVRPDSEQARRQLYRELARTLGVFRFTESAAERLRPAEEIAFRTDDAAPRLLFQRGEP